MANNFAMGGNLEISAAASLFRTRIIVFHTSNEAPSTDVTTVFVPRECHATIYLYLNDEAEGQSRYGWLYPYKHLFQRGLPTVPVSHALEHDLSSARDQIQEAGFEFELWRPQEGWLIGTLDDVKADPKDAQLLAAYQCFLALDFVKKVDSGSALGACAAGSHDSADGKSPSSSDDERIWVHLQAEMQAGKTGVVWALIRLILKNFSKKYELSKPGKRPEGWPSFNADNIRLITGMSDTSWKTQTQDRIHDYLAKCVLHNPTLDDLTEHLKCLASANGGVIKNVLIVIDESHIADCEANRPNEVLKVLSELTQNQMFARNVRVLTISATDPAALVDPRLRKAVRLRTADTYQSVKTLHEAKRIRDAEEYNDFDNAAIPEIARLIRNHYKGEKLYHVIRLKDGQSREEIKMRLKAELAPDDCEVIPWDCSSKENGENKDLNKLYLKKKPSCHTFILIKQMFSCAKTLCDQHVGILFERVATKCEDAFILQSLLGRACGYNKSKDTIIFTSKKVVDRYLDAWLPFFEGRCDLETALWSLHGDKKGNWKHIFKPHFSGHKIGLAPKHYKKSSRRREPDQVGKNSSEAKKVAKADAKAEVKAAKAAKAKAVAEASAAYDSLRHAYKSFEEAKSKHDRIKKPQQDDKGFCLSRCSGGKSGVLSETECLKFLDDPKRAQKITTELAVGKISSGNSTCRLIVCYKDTNDPSTAVYYVREAKKKQI